MRNYFTTHTKVPFGYWTIAAVYSKSTIWICCEAQTGDPEGIKSSTGITLQRFPYYYGYGDGIYMQGQGQRGTSFLMSNLCI
eukprot:6214054-Pleurochrysis_carterae.AAC.4